MTGTISAKRRELAQRTGDGTQVTLYWNEPTDRVTIVVSDLRSDETVEFEIDGRAALDAFNHPYAYAATRAHARRARVPQIG